MKSIISSLFAAVAFYTRLPVPALLALNFERVACFAPLVGLLIGGLLAFLDQTLAWLSMPALCRSAVVVIAWIGLTGGLHLDGAIDTADGLAVPDPERRLAVMTESTTGAFGVMAAAAILLLKTAALADLADCLTIWGWLVLPLAAGWGRWGQQVAIACFPYLKKTGKGAFHKAAIRSFWDVVPALLLLLGLSLLPVGLSAAAVSLDSWKLSLGLVAGSLIAGATAVWFGSRLGGHTGDTYGAVVEWTEAFLLVLLTISC
jgi:adenosylcobinamide-GDP ribazoletransferase